MAVSCFNSDRLDLKMKIQRNWLCATNLNKIEPGLYFSSIPIVSAGKSTKTVRFKGPRSFEDINLESRRIYTIHTSPVPRCLPRFPKKSCFLTGCDGSTEANTIRLDLQRQLFLGGEVGCNHLARPPTNHQGQLNRKFVHSLFQFIFQSFHFPQTKTVNIQYTCELVQICGRNSNQNQTLPMPCLPISSEKSSKTAATLLPFHMHSSLHPQWYGQEQPVRSDWNHGMNLAQGWDSANLQNLLYLLYILTLWIYRERLFCPSALWLLRDIRLPTQMPQYALALGIRWNIISSTNCHCVVLPHALITWKFYRQGLGSNKHAERKQQILWDIDGHRPLPGFLLSSRIEAHHIWPQEDLGFRQRLGRFQCFKGSRQQTGDVLHEFICTERANTSTFISRYYGWSTAVMLENTQNISLEGRDATIPKFYNHPRLPKDRVTCCIISKRQRARCHSLDFSQALMVALKLMISGCTSFADFMYSKAWRDLPSFQVSTRSGMFFVWLTRKRMRYGIWYLCQITSIYED